MESPTLELLNRHTDMALRVMVSGGPGSPGLMGSTVRVLSMFLTR